MSQRRPKDQFTLPLRLYPRVSKSEIVKQYSLLNTLSLFRSLPSMGDSGSNLNLGEVNFFFSFSPRSGSSFVHHHTMIEI